MATYIVVFMALISLAAIVEALPLKSRNIQNNGGQQMGSLLKIASRRLLKQRYQEDLNSMDRNETNTSEVDQILARVEEEYGFENLSRPVTDVSEENKSSILQFVFQAVIRKYSSYCPGTGLVELLAGFFSYSTYDVYIDESIENAIQNCYNETEISMNEYRKLVKHRVSSSKRHVGNHPTPSDFDQVDADPQVIRDRFQSELLNIIQNLDFVNFEGIFWQIDNYIYRSNLERTRMFDFLKMLTTLMLQSDNFTEQESCFENPRYAYANFSSQLYTVSDSLDKMSSKDLYGISSADTADEMASPTKQAIHEVIFKLDQFREGFSRKMKDIAKLLEAGQENAIEKDLASALNFNTRRLIGLYWPEYNSNEYDYEKDPSEHDYNEDDYADSYLTQLKLVNDIFMENGGNFYGYMSNYIREMFVTLFAKFVEKADKEDVNTDHLLEILNKVLANLNIGEY